MLGKVIPKDLIIDYSKKGWDGEEQGAAPSGHVDKEDLIDGKLIDSTRLTGTLSNTKDFYGLKTSTSQTT